MLIRYLDRHLVLNFFKSSVRRYSNLEHQLATLLINGSFEKLYRFLVGVLTYSLVTDLDVIIL